MDREQKANHLTAVTQELLASEGWTALIKAMDVELDDVVETMLGGGTPEEYHFHRGVVEGLRKVAGLPTKIINKSEFWLDRMGDE